MTATISSVELGELVSQPRFATYIDAAPTPSDAVALYEWNAMLSGAFYELLQHTEVILRNAMDREMSAFHVSSGQSGSWLDSTALLTAQMQRRVRKAREFRTRTRKPSLHDDIVSELSYGFWRDMLSKSQMHTLWVPALHRSFPNLVGNPSQVRNAVHHTFILRNRIAHHEPIHQRDLNRPGFHRDSGV